MTIKPIGRRGGGGADPIFEPNLCRSIINDNHVLHIRWQSKTACCILAA
jgi:hypothetical protein